MTQRTMHAWRVRAPGPMSAGPLEFVTTGVPVPADDEVLVASADRVGEIVHDMEMWMETFEYESVQQMRGSMSQRSVAEPAAFERANYMKALGSFDTRIW